ncbi:glycosyltransferase [Roseivirga sp.]|uniref:glycosyltransferase n=1 Tax=Roseivirga sp. TaxID=1964215 RepID=UPI002B274445|nr:glycosyltransferase [Roseivirga sp.]
MKVFIGLNNIASVFSDLKNGFSDLGIDTFIVSRYISSSVIIHDYADFNTAKVKDSLPTLKPRILNSLVRKVWGKLVDAYIFRKAVKECDVFVFISSSFREDFADLEYLKRKGKKIVCVFVGDDVRWFFAMEQEFKKHGLAPIEYDIDGLKTQVALKERLTRIRTCERYSDFIFSRLDQGQLQLRPYYRWNMMVNAKQINENRAQRKVRPIVAHAPSDRSIKGTKYVLRAIEELKNEGYDFAVKLIENVPNEKAVELYSDVDIVIDQLLCPGTGKLATEALASGAVVMANMSYDNYPQKNPADCPIVDVNPSTIKEELASLINDYERRSELAARGRAYVDKYLDIRIFCKKVINLIEGQPIQYDYIPSFFRNDYTPISEDEKELLNQWNACIQNEEWYGEFVADGEREGLKF